MKQGYKLRYDAEGRLPKEGLFELDHFTDAQIEAFSIRSQQVEAKLHQRGLTRESATSSHKQIATLQSRAKKTPKVGSQSSNRDDLFKEWVNRAKELNIEFSPKVAHLKTLGADRVSTLDLRSLESKEIESSPGSKVDILSASERPSEDQESIRQEPTFGREPTFGLKDAMSNIRFAIDHLTERQAVISETDLLNMALRHSRQGSRSGDIQKALQHFLKNGELIEAYPHGNPFHSSQAEGRPPKDKIKTQDGKWYTTPRAIADEQLILRLEAQGREILRPIMKEDEAQSLLQNSPLTLEQQNAAHMVLTTQNRVVGIQGFAGVGKSHLLKHCSQLIIEKGYEVEIIAPYNNQVKELKKLGVPSRTVISFLQNSRQSLHPQKILVVDEAGLVPTHLMKKLLSQVEKYEGHVVLLGDIMQLPAIEAGRDFAQLQKTGMPTLKLTNIQRQKTENLKEAVNLAARGQAIPSLNSIRNITEIKFPLKRYSRMARDYVQLAAEVRADTMLLTGTNASRTLLNEQVREQLGLQGKGRFFDVLHQRDMTQAEKAYAKYYKANDVIKLEKDYKSLKLKRGVFYEVQEVGSGNRLTVRDENNQLLTFNPSKYQAISTFEKERIELSPQDQVRFTSQDKKRGIEGGDCFEVLSVHESHILLKDKHRQVVLPTKDLLPLSHAYASTVHGSQGMNLHSVLLDLQTKSRTTDKNLYYVAISRARYEVQIYTDEIQALPTVLSRETFKPSALDVVKKGQPLEELNEIEMER